MKILLVLAVAAALGAVFLAVLGPEADNQGMAAEPAGRMLAHDVYFTLNDDSPQAKEKLVAACQKYLSTHPGTVWFAAGPLVEEHARDVNDRDFHVALHLVFKDKASHDAYQNAAEHHRFIEENRDNWKAVRVFDSYLDVSGHGDVEIPPAHGA